MERATRSGFAALIGRPNVGKSTLLNRLTGEKLAIVSPRPQTTRTRILGVVSRPEGQIAFVDTPGVHKATGSLNKLMVQTAMHAASECDVVVFLIEAEGLKEGRAPDVGPGNRFVLDELQRLKKPTVLVINKIDTVKRMLLLPLIDLYRQQFTFAEVVPVSARNGDGLEGLFEILLKHLPEAPPMFEADVFTDQAERTLVAEYVREQVLRHCRQEVPYSTAIVIDEFDESEREPDGRPQKGSLKGLVRIFATVFVERESQKAIVIGKKGAMLKEIGSSARKSIERLLGAHVYLSLRVQVDEKWSERPDALRRMGYGDGR
jgi:GTP-binding protein Era